MVVEKKRCADKDPPPPPPIPFIPTIHEILVWLPLISLLRFKLVCKSWCALIQTILIDLHTTTTSNKFGSFILHAAVDSEIFREDALFMLSSVSPESVCVSRSGSWCSDQSLGLWCTPGFNGICGLCDPSGSGGCWWRTDDGFCVGCWMSHNYVEDKDIVLGEVSDDDDGDDDKLSKIFRGLTVDQNHQVMVGDNNDNDQHQLQQLVLKLENLGFPSSCKIKPNMVRVVGSCNGLICLHDSDRGDVSLWNPATRQFRILPKPSSSSSSNAANGDDDDDCPSNRLFAFGFDEETQDYKVVLLSEFRIKPRRIIDEGLSVVVLGPMECFCRVQVYSLSTDSWRVLEGINVLPGAPFPYPPDSSSSSGQGQLLYLNGSCFFMAKFLYSEEEEEEECIPPPPPKDNGRFIISLDLTKEIIIPIQLPSHCGYEELYLCCLGKKIALFSKKIGHIGTDYWEGFRIRVLNEHSNNKGINENWTQIHRFAIPLGLPAEQNIQNIPRGISYDGVFALLETGIPGGLGNKKRMKLYNLVTKKFLNNSISCNQVLNNFLSCDQVLSNAYPYKPSLVSIIGGGNGSRAAAA